MHELYFIVSVFQDCSTSSEKENSSAEAGEIINIKPALEIAAECMLSNEAAEILNPILHRFAWLAM